MFASLVRINQTIPSLPSRVEVSTPLTSSFTGITIISTCLILLTNPLTFLSLHVGFNVCLPTVSTLCVKVSHERETKT